MEHIPECVDGHQRSEVITQSEQWPVLRFHDARAGRVGGSCILLPGVQMCVRCAGRVQARQDFDACHAVVGPVVAGRIAVPMSDFMGISNERTVVTPPREGA